MSPRTTVVPGAILLVGAAALLAQTSAYRSPEETLPMSLAPQPVTLLRIGGRDLDEVWIADADIVATGDDPHLCRTQATVELVDRRVDELLDRPLGNHLTVVPGHHAARFERWWRLTIA